MTGARRRRRAQRDDRTGGYLSELRSALASKGIRLTKRLGQHFLIDPNLNRVIARAAAGEAPLVLEVGPGAGSLTRPLLEAGATVVAVELDAKLAASLAEHVGGSDRLSVVHADALEGGKLSSRLVDAVTNARKRRGCDAFRVVSNLPYSIASTFLLALAGSQMPWSGGAVVLQREVAERLRARTGSHEYGAASVVWQLTAHGTIERTIPRDVFWPKPEVESALFDIAPRNDVPRVLAERLDEFGTFVKALFSQRRKILRSSATRAASEIGVSPGDGGALREHVAESIVGAGLDPSERAQNVAPSSIMALWERARST